MQGAQGPKGDAGVPGPKGLTWRGAWDPATAYVPDDSVEYGGSAYIAVASSTGAAPPGAAWTLLAAASLAESVVVTRVQEPVAVSGIAAPVTVSSVSAPVAVASIADPVAVSSVASPVAVSGISTAVEVSRISTPVQLAGPVQIAGTVPVSIAGTIPVTVSTPAVVTTPDGNPLSIESGIFDDGATITCPAGIPGANCRTAIAGPFVLTDLVGSYTGGSGWGADMRSTIHVWAAAGPAAPPRWRLAFRFADVTSQNVINGTARSISGARFAVREGETLYMGLDGFAMVTWSGFRP